MGRGVFRFRARGAETAAALEPKVALADVDMAEQPELFTADMELMRQTPPMSDRDEVIFLLQTAAEIEHSLLAQYLYSAYSLNKTGKQMEWRATLLEIAREEMAHLLSVQNLLRVLGGPLNFEREDFPFNVLYPFPFRLEPFTLKSIARYVLAEMPDPSTIPPELCFDVEQVKRDAQVTEPGEMVNRVGALFAKLLELVDKLKDHSSDAPGDFRPETMTLQAQEDEGWVIGNMILDVVTSKAEAKALLDKIGRQGEGPGEPGTEGLSHFRRFFKIYTEIKANPEDAKSRVVPVNPTTQEPPKCGSNPNFIAAPLARAWADLFNNRYRILLANLAHILTVAPDDKAQPKSRTTILDWIFSEMLLNLAPIADTLATIPRHEPPQFGDAEQRVLIAAGAPFALPYTLQLPDQPIDRWRQHQQLLAEASLRIAAVKKELGGSIDILDRMMTSDQAGLDFAREQIVNLSKPPDCEGDFIMKRDSTYDEQANTRTEQIRYPDIQKILDDAVKGQDIGAHGAFWRQLTRDQFVVKKVFGCPIIFSENGKFIGPRSPLVQILKAPIECPVGRQRPQMPVGFPPVAPEKVQTISDWIDAQCPA